ncbi:unnamed protein product [Bemisia tabaci]|uniref:Peptidase C1A papain C-terminal domain-containing protein n=2 Tax=Bemisia tabaci TaxID=7038 RepID=A0A9P0C2Q7_BEMTA|nr:unnamed protein product [Bemisia tabaci]
MQNIDPFKTDPIPAKFSSPATEPPVTGSKPTNPAVASPSTDSKPASSAVASPSTGQQPATSAVVPPSTGQKPVAPVLRHPVTGQIVPVIRHPVTGQIVHVVRHPVTGQIVPVAHHPMTGPRPHPGAPRPVVGVKPLTVKPPLPERCLTRNGSYVKPPGPGYNRTAPPCADSPKVSPITKNVLRDVHWIESEFYPPAQDQNEANDSCGGCWAYSSASVMEILVSRKLRQVIRLSKQQLLDCEKENNGCDGGDLQNGLHYIMETGLALERDYPFTGRGGGTCKNVSDKIIVRMLEMEFTDSPSEIISGLKKSPMPLSFYAPYGIQMKCSYATPGDRIGVSMVTSGLNLEYVQLDWMHIQLPSG